MEIHLHDVQFIWNFWPFNVLIFQSFRNFLDGHGLNIGMNIINELTLVPRLIWNTATGIFFLPINMILTFLSAIPNGIMWFFEKLVFWLPDLIFELYTLNRLGFYALLISLGAGLMLLRSTVGFIIGALAIIFWIVIALSLFLQISFTIIAIIVFIIWAIWIAIGLFIGSFFIPVLLIGVIWYAIENNGFPAASSSS